MIAMLDVSGDMSLVRTDASYCHYTMLLATRENSASGTDCLTTFEWFRSQHCLNF